MEPEGACLWVCFWGCEDAEEMAVCGFTEAGEGPAAEVLEEDLEGVDLGGMIADIAVVVVLGVV